MKRPAPLIAFLIACPFALAAFALSQEENSDAVSLQRPDVRCDGQANRHEAEIDPALSLPCGTTHQKGDSSVNRSQNRRFETGREAAQREPQAQSVRQSMSFDQLDADRDGYVNQNEATLDASLIKKYGDVDQDQDGYLSRLEFESAKAGQGTNVAEFARLDINKDGFLSRAEVQGIPLIVQEFSSLDTNMDGWISTQEYRSLRGRSEAPMGHGISIHEQEWLHQWKRGPSQFDVNGTFPTH